MGNKQMDYLSDEELMRLIQETEGQEMLMAPSYLKSEILTKLAESEKAKTTSIELEHSTYEIAPVQGGEILPIEGNKKVWSKKKTLMIYQFKVAAVATAAIFALFVMPMGNNRSQMPQNENRNQASVTRTINERTNSFCNSLFELSNGIISPQDNRK